MAKLLAFHDTLVIYREFTQYSQSLSFEEWLKKPDSHKAALLYVQFYNAITLAWNKVNTFDFIDGEEGVETICQYLQKNVKFIEDQPSRYTPAYIYKIAYNCLYCICHDRKCDKDRWENETDNVVRVDGKELSIFDSIHDKNGSAEDCFNKMQFNREFWLVVEEFGSKAEKVLRYLLSNDAADLKKINVRSKKYASDPLRDVEVSLDEAQDIIRRLRDRFMMVPASSNCGQYILSLI